MFQAISNLVENGWNFFSWGKRYGGGVYVALIPSSCSHTMDEIDQITSGGDLPACAFNGYLYNEGSWLPIVAADNFESGVKELLYKFNHYSSADEWSEKIDEVLRAITGCDYFGYGLQIIIDKNENDLFTFDQLEKFDYSSIADIPFEILHILESGNANEIQCKLLFEFYRTRESVDYYGGGGVDGNGIYSEYIVNYHKENEKKYKIYEKEKL